LIPYLFILFSISRASIKRANDLRFDLAERAKVQTPVHCAATSNRVELSDLLTPEQEAQLTILLANLMAHKYGTLEIEIVDGKVKFFKPKPSIKAKPPFD